MGKGRKRFTSERNAEIFAKKVDGKVNDLRDIKAAKSPFTVTYKKTEKTRRYASKRSMSDDWRPEEGRDFGYPNEYWQ